MCINMLHDGYCVLYVFFVWVNITVINIYYYFFIYPYCEVHKTTMESLQIVQRRELHSPYYKIPAVVFCSHCKSKFLRLHRMQLFIIKQFFYLIYVNLSSKSDLKCKLCMYMLSLNYSLKKQLGGLNIWFSININQIMDFFSNVSKLHYNIFSRPFELIEINI